MTKRYQRGNQEGTNQRRTDNTMTKRYQMGNQEGTNQRRTVSFGHCIVSPSLIYASGLPLWYLLAIVLSVLL
jgi:hypothetical protein